MRKKKKRKSKGYIHFGRKFSKNTNKKVGMDY